MDKKLADIVVRSGAYRDLSEPVILAGGDLGIYYVNAEKVCGPDTSFIEKYADDPQAMIAHTIELQRQNPDFDYVIKTLAQAVTDVMQGAKDYKKVISGGQRRDWVFSGPVAHLLGLGHTALFKNRHVDRRDAHGKTILDEVGHEVALHVADMLTVGSSAYDPKTVPPTGWIPRLRELGYRAHTYFPFISRKQGGEEVLERANIATVALVTIDRTFLENHSTSPSRAVDYFIDPDGWSRRYLAERPLESFVKHFNPAGKDVSRARNFIDKYGGHLVVCKKYESFDKMVREAYGKTIQEIVGVQNEL